MASLDHTDEKRSGKNLEMHFGLPGDDGHPISHQKQSSCSSSLSDSSRELIVLENNENGVDTFESKHVSTLSYSSDFVYPSPVWSFQSVSVTQCPPSQMMARPGYDPNRIPLSVFSSRPTNSLAWSHNSNESLFSIQAGNNSFSRDHFFLGNKCVESPRFDESIRKSTAMHHVGELVPSNYAKMKGHSDSESATDTSEETKDSLMLVPCESVETLAESATILLHETPEDNCKEGMAPREEAKDIISMSYCSEESLMSAQTFQFPVLGVESGRKRLVTIKTEKQELEKPIEPPSPKVETAPNPRPRNRWYFFSCCSPCRGESNH